MKRHIRVAVLLTVATVTTAYAQMGPYVNEINSTTDGQPYSDIEIIKGTAATIQGTEGRYVSKSNVRVGAGMERIKIEGMDFVLPKGTRVYREGGVIKFEDTSEYLARNFDYIGKGMDEMTKKIGEQDTKIDELTRQVKDLRSLVTNSKLNEQP